MSQMNKITSGSTELTIAAPHSLPHHQQTAVQWTSQHSKKPAPTMQVFVPLVKQGTAAKWASPSRPYNQTTLKKDQQSQAQASAKRQSSRAAGSRSQLQKKDSFLLDTRLEQLKMQAQQEQKAIIEESANRVMLNQPSFVQ